MKSKIAIIVLSVLLVAVSVVCTVSLVSLKKLKNSDESEKSSEATTEKSVSHTEYEGTTYYIGEEETEKETEETTEESKFDVHAQNCYYFYVSVGSSSLNVREKPDEKSKKVGSLEKGKLILVDTTSPYDPDEWVYIKYYDENSDEYYSYGWVKSEHITMCDNLMSKVSEWQYCNETFRFNVEHGQKNKADIMMKSLFSFSQEYSNILDMETYKFIGTSYGDDEGYNYVYVDYKDYLTSCEADYCTYYVTPDEDKILIVFYEACIEVYFEEDTVKKIYTVGFGGDEYECLENGVIVQRYQSED